MENTGFIVKSDRFNLKDPTCYLLDGWLNPGTKIQAHLGRKDLPVHIETLSEKISENEQGLEARLHITVPEDLGNAHALNVYTSQNTNMPLNRNNCFHISVEDLKEKRKPIQCYIDDVNLNTHDNICKITGWCVSREPVEMALADFNKSRIDCEIERYIRKDVVQLYWEYPVEERCGFYIELQPIPRQKVYLLMRAGEDRLVQTIATSVIIRNKQQVERQMQKGFDYLQYRGVTTLAQQGIRRVFSSRNQAPDYSKWIMKHLPSQKDLEEQRNHTFALTPKISIVVPLYRTPRKYLDELITSVREQSYTNWELCLSDGSGTPSPLRQKLDSYARMDERIHPFYHDKRLRISENTNAAIEASTGSYVVFADHDDLLAPDALYQVVKVINEHPDAALIYSDEDKVSVNGEYMQPNMKPDFNLDLLRTVNYICHMLVIKRDLLDQVGWLRPAYDGAQDYDLILRCIEQTDAIYHIPRILYHWRLHEGSTAEDPESKLYAFDSGKHALEDYYDRLGIRAKVIDGEFLGLYRTTYLRDRDPLVSIVIPNKDHIDDLKRCMRSIDEKSTYHNYEYMIIENNSEEQETFAYYEELEKTRENVHVEYWDGPFNYAAINNFGVSKANGEYILLLNNDVEVINDDWLEELLSYCMREEVGVVGARLYYEDETIQHAGVVIGFGGIAGHCFVQQKRGVTGYQHRIICTQDYSAVTAACMMVKKSVFQEVGGLSEELAVAFNDVDFCLKVREIGKLVVYNAYVQLYHYESKSRGLEDTPEKIKRFQHEIEIFNQKWPDILRDGDPYYNPNLTLESQDFSLRQI